MHAEDAGRLDNLAVAAAVDTKPLNVKVYNIAGEQVGSVDVTVATRSWTTCR